MVNIVALNREEDAYSSSKDRPFWSRQRQRNREWKGTIIYRRADHEEQGVIGRTDPQSSCVSDHGGACNVKIRTADPGQVDHLTYVCRASIPFLSVSILRQG